MTEQKIITGVDPLKHLFMTNRYSKTFTQEDALKIDLTDVFMLWLKAKIKLKELHQITIRGEQASSKSTVGMAIKTIINKHITEAGLNKNIDEFKTIVGDQIEFIRYISKSPQHECIVIDEYSAFAQGGINATTEAQVFLAYTEIFAQRYIHRIFCTPMEHYDELSTVILDVIGKDTDKKYTTCKLVYRSPTDKHTLTLGIIKIYVGDIIEKEWYKRYRQKKFDRMELLERHGVRDIRELEFSIIALETYERLKELAFTGETTNEVVMPTVARVLQDNKRIVSMLATGEIVTRAKAPLSIITKIAKLQEKEKKTTLTPEKRNKIDVAIRTHFKILKELLDHYRHQQTVYEEYLQISGDKRK